MLASSSFASRLFYHQQENREKNLISRLQIEIIAISDIYSPCFLMCCELLQPHYYVNFSELNPNSFNLMKFFMKKKTFRFEKFLIPKKSNRS